MRGKGEVQSIVYLLVLINKLHGKICINDGLEDSLHGPIFLRGTFMGGVFTVKLPFSTGFLNLI